MPAVGDHLLARPSPSRSSPSAMCPSPMLVALERQRLAQRELQDLLGPGRERDVPPRCPRAGAGRRGRPGRRWPPRRPGQRPGRSRAPRGPRHRRQPPPPGRRPRTAAGPASVRLRRAPGGRAPVSSRASSRCSVPMRPGAAGEPRTGRGGDLPGLVGEPLEHVSPSAAAAPAGRVLLVDGLPVIPSSWAIAATSSRCRARSAPAGSRAAPRAPAGSDRREPDRGSLLLAALASSCRLGHGCHPRLQR